METVNPNGKFQPCNLSKGYCFIDSDGYMYPCVNLFGKFGKNVLDVGVKGVWDYLEEKDCLFCRQSTQGLKSDLFSSDIGVLFGSLKVAAINFFNR